MAVGMFRFFGRYYDEHNCAPPLFARLLQLQPEIQSIENLQRWFDALTMVHKNTWRIRLARLAAAATLDADEAKDPSDKTNDAVRVVLNSAGDMLGSIRIALNKWPEAKSLPIVLQGGNFEYSRVYRNAVVTEVAKLTSGEVGLARNRPAVGAMIMACAPPPDAPGVELHERIQKAIEELPEHEQALVVRSTVKRGSVATPHFISQGAGRSSDATSRGTQS